MTVTPAQLRYSHGTDPEFGGAVEDAVSQINETIRGVNERLTEAEGTIAAGTYSPGDVADWAGSPPTTIAEALDRLANATPGA
jgi:hypothetical protein